MSLIFILAAFFADIFMKRHKKSKHKSTFWVLIPVSRWEGEGQPVQLKAAVGGQGLACHEADPGLAKLRWTVWHQAVMKTHKTNMVMEWLYTRTGCMPSGAWGGTPWPPTHLIPTHVISFFGGTWKREWTNLSLETWLHWRGQLGVEFGKIPEVIWCRSPSWKGKRGETSGLGCPPSSTWWQASCTERWCLAISSPSWPVVAWHHLAVSQFIWAWLALGPVSW